MNGSPTISNATYSTVDATREITKCHMYVIKNDSMKSNIQVGSVSCTGTCWLLNYHREIISACSTSRHILCESKRTCRFCGILNINDETLLTVTYLLEFLKTKKVDFRKYVVYWYNSSGIELWHITKMHGQWHNTWICHRRINTYSFIDIDSNSISLQL